MIWLKRGSGCTSDLRLGGIAGNVANIHHGNLGPFAAAIGARIRVFNSIGPQGAPKVARGFWIEQREAPFMYEGHYYTVERIRSLLVASVETGNSIYWC